MLSYCRWCQIVAFPESYREYFRWVWRVYLNWANKWLNLRKSLSYKIIKFSFLSGRDTIILSSWELQNWEPWQTRPRSINRLPPTVLKYSYKTIFLPGLLHWYPLVQTKSLLLHFISFLAWWFLDNDNNRRACTLGSILLNRCSS